MKEMSLKAKVLYVLLVLPLFPLGCICIIGEALSQAKWPYRWTSWAEKVVQKIEGS
ncbi:hypothetical protein A1c_00009 [Klebsiella phage VLCpiA1c]|nr:hypothetical protein A1c_00009 [Klebsiella phage VLCpiA1c]